MAKLKPDYISWVLTLNATQAQEEFHKLEKENKEPPKQTNATRKAMAQLELVRSEAARLRLPVSNYITELITKGLER